MRILSIIFILFSLASGAQGQVVPPAGERNEAAIRTQARTFLQVNNVDNTSDANKPVSTATQTALDGKEPLLPTKTGNAGKFLKVNAAANGWELTALAGGGDLLAANNLSDLSNVGTARTNLGATTVGSNLFTLTNPGAVRYLRINADNTVTARTAAELLTDLGALANTTTSGVAATPTASGTVTITHNLGRVPTTIRIKSISSFTSNAAATPVPFSYGTWNSTGNRCLYMVINGTTTQVSQTSTTFSIIMVTSAGNSISGVIQNVGATTFDIVFTETGTHTAGNYLWEAQ